jgi:hypothetical protein
MWANGRGVGHMKNREHEHSRALEHALAPPSHYNNNAGHDGWGMGGSGEGTKSRAGRQVSAQTCALHPVYTTTTTVRGTMVGGCGRVLGAHKRASEEAAERSDMHFQSSSHYNYSVGTMVGDVDGSWGHTKA